MKTKKTLRIAIATIFLGLVVFGSYIFISELNKKTDKIFQIDAATGTYYLFDAKPNIAFNILSNSTNTFKVFDSNGRIVETQIETNGKESTLKAPKAGYVPGETYTLSLSDGAEFTDSKLKQVRILKFNIVIKDTKIATYVDGVKEINTKSVLSISDSEVRLKRNSSVQLGDVIIVKDPENTKNVFAYKVLAVDSDSQSDIFQVITPKIDEVYKDIQIHTKVELSEENIEVDESEVIKYVKESGMFGSFFRGVQADTDKSEWKIEVSGVKNGARIKVEYSPTKNNEKFNVNSYMVVFTLKSTAYLNARGLNDVEVVIDNTVDVHIAFSPKFVNSGKNTNYFYLINDKTLTYQKAKEIVSEAKQTSKISSFLGVKFLKVRVPIYGMINFVTESGISANFNEAIDINTVFELKLRASNYIFFKDSEFSAKTNASVSMEKGSFEFAGSLSLEASLNLSGGIEFLPGSVLGIEGSITPYAEMRGLFKTNNILDTKSLQNFFFEFEVGFKPEIKAFLNLDLVKKKIKHEVPLVELHYPLFEFSTVHEMKSLNMSNRWSVNEKQVKTGEIIVLYNNIFTDEEVIEKLNTSRLDLYVNGDQLDEKDEHFYINDYIEGENSVIFSWTYKNVEYEINQKINIIRDIVKIYNVGHIHADEIYPFVEDNILFVNNRFGLVADSGKILLEPQYDWIGFCRFDNSRIAIKDGRIYEIAEDYNVVLSDKHTSHGDSDTSIYAYDRTENILYKSTTNISYWIPITNWDGPEYAFVQSIFKFISVLIPGEYGLVSFSDKGDSSTNVNVISEFEYKYASGFSENGYAAVFKDGLWGFIDKTGKMRIPFQYEDLQYPVDGKGLYLRLKTMSQPLLNSFSSSGYAVVKKNGKWLIINANNDVLFENDEVLYIGHFLKNKVWFKDINGWYIAILDEN